MKKIVVVNQNHSSSKVSSGMPCLKDSWKGRMTLSRMTKNITKKSQVILAVQLGFNMPEAQSPDQCVQSETDGEPSLEKTRKTYDKRKNMARSCGNPPLCLWLAVMRCNRFVWTKRWSSNGDPGGNRWNHKLGVGFITLMRSRLG